MSSSPDKLRKSITAAVLLLAALLGIWAALEPSRRTESGVSYLIFILKTFRFELIFVTAIYLAILFFGFLRSSYQIPSMKKFLLRSRTLARMPRVVAVHSVLAVMLLSCSYLVGEATYQLIKARWFYTSRLVDHDYKLEPLRAAYQAQTERRLRDANDAYAVAETNGILSPTAAQNYRQVIFLMEYVNNLTHKTSANSGGTTVDRLTYFRTIEILRLAPRESFWAQNLETEISRLRDVQGASGEFWRACNTESIDHARDIVQLYGWYLFEPLILEELSRGPYGEAIEPDTQRFAI